MNREFYRNEKSEIISRISSFFVGELFFFCKITSIVLAKGMKSDNRSGS